MNKKVIVYQVFTRLFGNTNTTNKPWGTIEENGVGKFADFTAKALKEIKALGMTHIWFTGVLHHAMVADYKSIGISDDHADVVKGRAGSPYAIKDYYNVNPDLAVNPEKRLQEFKALIDRTHKAGLKVIIDIVLNHVARNYDSISLPKGEKNFGAEDNTSVAYHRDNNFYYVPNEGFRLPHWENGYLPLGGEQSSRGSYHEFPAKWTGNGSRSPQPGFNDWYETVKVNYGVRPDGGYEFDDVPEEIKGKPAKEHAAFWANKSVPNTWEKFKAIAAYWLDFGVDGFRYDMAEMVPVPFWSYLNAAIKQKNPEAIVMAEVYNPGLYREYIFGGLMDYLYDKVDLYDGLKHIMKGYGWTDHIQTVQSQLGDIQEHLLYFLENHDEQRIAHPEFVGNPLVGDAGDDGTSYPEQCCFDDLLGQEVGEPAMENAGFGSASRTSIFDYIGVPAFQRWVNNKKYDGGQSTSQERMLRNYYKQLLNLALTEEAFDGEYQEIHFYNKEHTEHYDHRLFSFVRWKNGSKVIGAGQLRCAKKLSYTVKSTATCFV